MGKTEAALRGEDWENKKQPYEYENKLVLQKDHEGVTFCNLRKL